MISRRFIFTTQTSHNVEPQNILTQGSICNQATRQDLCDTLEFKSVNLDSVILFPIPEWSLILLFSVYKLASVESTVPAAAAAAAPSAATAPSEASAASTLGYLPEYTSINITLRVLHYILIYLSSPFCTWQPVLWPQSHYDNVHGSLDSPSQRRGAGRSEAEWLVQ